jgi:hypothetical protein
VPGRLGCFMVLPLLAAKVVRYLCAGAFKYMKLKKSTRAADSGCFQHSLVLNEHLSLCSDWD